jgi:hypothetical protein
MGHTYVVRVRLVRCGHLADRERLVPAHEDIPVVHERLFAFAHVFDFGQATVLIARPGL